MIIDPSDTDAAVVRFDAVRAAYREDVPVLDGLSLLVDRGATLLTGPNGSGKSTVVELVSGSMRPLAGRVEVLGRPAHDRELRHRRAVCRAAVTLYPALTVREHLELLDLSRPGFADATARRLDRYRLDRWLDNPVFELSTGNARKLWLLMTTAGSRELYVLDEPFAGLDDESVQDLVAETHQWLDNGASVVVVAHAPPTELTERYRRVELAPITGAPRG